MKSQYDCFSQPMPQASQRYLGGLNNSVGAKQGATRPFYLKMLMVHRKVFGCLAPVIVVPHEACERSQCNSRLHAEEKRAHTSKMHPQLCTWERVLPEQPSTRNKEFLTRGEKLQSSLSFLTGLQSEFTALNLRHVCGTGRTQKRHKSARTKQHRYVQCSTLVQCNKTSTHDCESSTSQLRLLSSLICSRCILTETLLRTQYQHSTEAVSQMISVSQVCCIRTINCHIKMCKHHSVKVTLLFWTQLHTNSFSFAALFCVSKNKHLKKRLAIANLLTYISSPSLVPEVIQKILSSGGVGSSAVQLPDHQHSRQHTDLIYNSQVHRHLDLSNSLKVFLLGGLLFFNVHQKILLAVTFYQHHFICSPGKLNYYQDGDYIGVTNIKSFTEINPTLHCVHNRGKLFKMNQNQEEKGHKRISATVASTKSLAQFLLSHGLIGWFKPKQKSYRNVCSGLNNYSDACHAVCRVGQRCKGREHLTIPLQIHRKNDTIKIHLTFSTNLAMYLPTQKQIASSVMLIMTKINCYRALGQLSITLHLDIFSFYFPLEVIDFSITSPTRSHHSVKPNSTTNSATAMKMYYLWSRDKTKQIKVLSRCDTHSFRNSFLLFRWQLILEKQGVIWYVQNNGFRPLACRQFYLLHISQLFSLQISKATFINYTFRCFEL